jgi:hypothetical protein
MRERGRASTIGGVAKWVWWRLSRTGRPGGVGLVCERWWAGGDVGENPRLRSETWGNRFGG